jgi:hypothetical protein
MANTQLPTNVPPVNAPNGRRLSVTLLSRGRTSRSSSAGPKVRMIGYRLLLPI